MHMYIYIYICIYISDASELSRTPMSRTGLVSTSGAWAMCMFHVRVLLSFQQPTFQQITTHQLIFSCTCRQFFCFR